MECCILFFGDIVGRPGRAYLKQRFPFFREKFSPHFIFANAENANGGFGLNGDIAQELHALGIHGLTLGNHIWDQRSLWSEIDSLPYVCRPCNLPPECPGRTALIFECHQQKIALINVLGRVFLNTSLDCPFKSCQVLMRTLRQEGVENFIFDVHAEATAEKQTLAWFLEKQGAVAVLGTHTHVQTADACLLNGKTAFLCDVGMCGAAYGVLGFQADPIIEKSMYGKPCRFEVASGPAMINGICLRFDLDAHRALSLEPIHEIEGEAN